MAVGCRASFWKPSGKPTLTLHTATLRAPTSRMAPESITLRPATPTRCVLLSVQCPYTHEGKSTWQPDAFVGVEHLLLACAFLLSYGLFWRPSLLTKLMLRLTHTQVGVEECRREEALHAASWLVFWAKGPSQAHEWFGGDELAVRLSIYVTRDRAAFRSQLPLLAGACCGQCP